MEQWKIDEDLLMELDEEPEDSGKKEVKQKRNPERKLLYPSLDLDAAAPRAAPVVASKPGPPTQEGTVKTTGSLYPSLPPEPPLERQPVIANHGKESQSIDPEPLEQRELKAQTAKRQTAQAKVEQPKRQSVISKLKNKLTPSSSKSKLAKAEHNEEASAEEGTGQNEVLEEEEEIEEAPRTLAEDPLAQCWFEVFEEVGLPAEAAEEYALGFSKFGIDDSNAGTLSDEDLQEHGIKDAVHRRTILQLIDALMQHQREAAQASAPSKQEKTVSWEEVEQVEHSLQDEITKVERLEGRIAKILAGDTDRQRKFKARLAEERTKRDAAREEKRRNYQLRKAQREYSRIKKELDGGF